MRSLGKIIPSLVFLSPILVNAGGGLIPCDGPDCNFCHFIQLGQNLIEFLVIVAIPLAAIAFAWAGFTYMTSGGNQQKVAQAHGIFTKVAIGLVLVLGAYLIVDLIITALTEHDSVSDLIGC
ncbi:MAG: pilin [Candidatus Paceibacterota bacterium]